MTRLAANSTKLRETDPRLQSRLSDRLGSFSSASVWRGADGLSFLVLFLENSLHVKVKLALFLDALLLNIANNALVHGLPNHHHKSATQLIGVLRRCIIPASPTSAGSGQRRRWQQQIATFPQGSAAKPATCLGHFESEKVEWEMFIHC